MPIREALTKIADALERARDTARASGLSGDAVKMAVCREVEKIRKDMSEGKFDPLAP